MCVWARVVGRRRQWCIRDRSWLVPGSVLVVWRTSFCHWSCNIEDSSALSNFPIPPLASSTTSIGDSVPGWVRKNSRASRFIRLRSTARLNRLLLTVVATWYGNGASKELCVYRTKIDTALSLEPSANALSNTITLFKRSFFPNVFLDCPIWAQDNLRTCLSYTVQSPLSSMALLQSVH